MVSSIKKSKEIKSQTSEVNAQPHLTSIKCTHSIGCLSLTSMATSSLLLFSCFILHLASSSQSAVLNKIDSCRLAKSNWASNRQALADCVIGFGKDAIGGKYGAIYKVTDPSDDPISPKPGTLRYGVVQTQPLWIIFAKDMTIKLKNELIMNSYKTIDGRGAKVEITNGPCITIQGVSHVIIHGISIHDCKPSKAGLVMSTPSHVGHRQGSDGDGISIFASSNVWIDHCFFARCFDGLIDVIHASTAITISNNYFTQHDKVSVTILTHSIKLLLLVHKMF